MATAANILIVEDEMLVALELEQVLLDLGHNPVGIAPDLDTALALATDGIDIALVDVNLRDGPTGPVVGQLLSSDYNVSVVFMTANPCVLEQGVAGALGFLTKPANEDVVSSAVDYCVRARAGERANAPAQLRLFG